MPELKMLQNVLKPKETGRIWDENGCLKVALIRGLSGVKGLIRY